MQFKTTATSSIKKQIKHVPTLLMNGKNQKSIIDQPLIGEKNHHVTYIG
jgi:hypothetical protein